MADCKEQVDALLARYGVAGRYIAIETQNWNAVWESNFPPVDVEGRLLIHAPFHEPAPAGVMEVVVMPKMSFGTGHHATTWLVSRAVLDLGVAGRRGLDMGSGTGVLAIVAAKCGAAHVDAVDIDDWADENCRENIASNGVADRIEPMLGDVRRIAGRHYGFILANINRNILTADMPAYAAALEPGGDLVMSGFLEQDVPAIVACAGELGLRPVATAARRVDDGSRAQRVGEDVQRARSRSPYAQIRRLVDGRLPADRCRRPPQLHGAGGPQPQRAGFEAGVVPADVPRRVRGVGIPAAADGPFQEVRAGFVLQSLPFDVRKSTMALFMAEVLYRLVREYDEPNQALFDFVWNSVGALDSMDEGVANSTFGSWPT